MKPWVGTTSIPKPQPGQTILESATFTSTLSDADTFRRFTTAEGLGQWLDTVTTFDSRRGGTLKFESGFGGSYSLIRVPAQVVLATDIHGEIDIRMDPKRSPMRVDVTITRFVRVDEDLDGIRSAVQRTLNAIRTCLDV
jgi:hypothetical protein